MAITTTHQPMLAADVKAVEKIVVSVKKNWVDNWQEMDGHLIPESCSDAASPAMPVAKFTWEYGRILEPKAADFVNWKSRDDLMDQFVKIEIEDQVAYDSSTGKRQRTAIFYGVFAGDSRKIEGSQVDAKLETGDQILTAFGLQYLLDRVPLQKAFITNDGLYPLEIGIAPVFNERFVRGLNKLGNCSSQKVFDEAGKYQAFLFSEDHELWTNRDIVEYLLTHFQPSGVYFELDERKDPKDATRRLSNSDELENIITPRLDLAGLSLKECLDRLIPRHRGLGWSLRVAEAGASDGNGGTNAVTKVYLWVFSVLDQDIFFGSSTLSDVVVRGNKEIVSTYDISGLEVEQATRVLSSSTAFGTIRVIGEAARAMFTLSFADGTLRKGWSDAQETLYKAVDLGSPDKNDSERSNEKYAPVYQYFLIPALFDWRAGDGAGGGKSYVAVSFKKDGTVQWTIPSPMRQWGAARVFEDRLLIEDKETEVLQDAPEFVAPFALIKADFAGASRFVRCHKTGVPSLPDGHVSMLDNHAGVELHYSPNHQVGKGSFNSGSPKPSNVMVPKLDYHDLIVTVACKIDQRLEVSSTIAPNDPDRVLTIEVPEAHFWYIVPGTATDVANGALVKHSPASPSLWSLSYPLGNVLRNDVDRLKRVAALAQVWYGRDRSAISLAMRAMTIDLKVGYLIAQLVDSNVFTDVHTVVSEVLFDLRKRTTQITTNYAELDFVEK